MNAPIPSNPGIIILGMHRSGTSLAAELVQKWGAFGDEATMAPGDTSNPRGYWEPAPLVRFNEELLGMVQSRWNVPPSVEAKARLAAMAEDPEFRRRALDLLTSIRVSGRPWFWKDPRLSILLPFWKRFWGDVLFVIPVRDPGDIAQSLRHRDGTSPGHALLLWQKYMLDIFEDEQVRSAGVFLGYEDLLADPVSECGRLCRVLDERLGAFTSDLADRDHRLEKMIGAVDPTLWRSRDESRFLRNPLASEGQRALYHALLLHSKGEAQRYSDDFALEPQWRQTLLSQDLLQRLGIASALCQIYWRGSQTEYAEDRSKSVRVAMDWTPQHIQIALPLSPDSGEAGIRVDLADRPALAWLTGLALRDSAANIVWAWDGHADSLANLAQNDVAFCRQLKGEDGCLLWLDGFDPWIELAFHLPQSALLTDGVSLEICCTYSATFEQHFLKAGNASASNTRRTLEHLKLLEDRQTELHRETLEVLQALERKQTEVQLLVQGILHGRIWRTIAWMERTLGWVLGPLSRGFRRLWGRN